MNWQNAERIAGTVCLLTLTGCMLYCAARLQPILRHADGALTRLEGVESKANATLVNLDKGTKVWADGAKQQAAAIEDLATDAHGTLSQVGNLAFALNKSAGNLDGSLGELNKTLDAAAGTAHQATADLATLNGSLAGVEPLLSRSDAAVADLDELLKRQAVGQILDHAAGITTHADAITADLEAVSDKATKDFLTPKPFWRKVGQYAGDSFDLAALFARHTP